MESTTSSYRGLGQKFMRQFQSGHSQKLGVNPRLLRLVSRRVISEWDRHPQIICQK